MTLSRPLGWFAAGLLALPAYYLWVHGNGGGGASDSPTSFRVVSSFRNVSEMKRSQGVADDTSVRAVGCRKVEKA